MQNPSQKSRDQNFGWCCAKIFSIVIQCGYAASVLGSMPTGKDLYRFGLIQVSLDYYLYFIKLKILGNYFI